MAVDTQALLASGHEALEAGDWTAARAAFETALAEEESAEALFGAGEAGLWLGDTAGCVRRQERAYAAFRRRGDPVEAAMTGIGLFYVHQVSLGNHAVARGWLGRVARLVDEHDLEPLRGWVLLMQGEAAGDPKASEALAREARERARAEDDADLELCSLAQLGTALVEQGRVEEGFALLDESMAGSLGGEAERLDTVVFTTCQMITSCSRTAEWDRAAEWVRAGDGFVQRYGSPHLYTRCRLHYGRVLLATGRWAECERELQAALATARSAEPGLLAEALGALAELRLAQGRLDEAAGLIDGHEGHPAAVGPAAAVALARGDAARAAALLGRRLRAIGEGRLEAAPLLERLSEAALALGDLARAERAAEDLGGLAALADCDCLTAAAARARGRLLAAGERAAAATAPLEAALALYTGLGMPLDEVRCRLLLAASLAGGDRAGGVAEAQAALAGAERLGAPREADAAAALLRSLGVKAGRGGRAPSLGELTKREREVLALIGEGLTNQAMAERLFLTRKTVEHHVRSVLGKLGLSNRAQAAAYAVRHLEPEPADR